MISVATPWFPSPEIGSGYFQETQPEILFRECSHYCQLVSSPAQMPRVLEEAIRAALKISAHRVEVARVQ